MAVEPISSPIGSVNQPSNTLSPSNSGMRTYFFLDMIFLIAVCTGLISVIARPFLIDLLKYLRSVTQIKPQPRISCSHCHYFSQNPYLKCALHPTTVLTEQAADCRDYTAQNTVTERNLASPKIFND
jgi:hypothetical protein